METSKEQLDYSKFLEQFEDDILDQDYDCFYAYGPLTSKYWETKPRILVCNEEPYDERKRKIVVDIDLYKEWMNVNTGLYTSKFITGLISMIEHNNNILNSDINFKNFSREYLLSMMGNVAYLNFRISSGIYSKENRKAIISEVSNYKEYLKNQINLLNPDIIVIGGRTGCDAFNIIFDSGVKYDNVEVFGDRIICSIKHPSRPSYKAYNSKIKDIVTLLSTFNN